MGVLTDIVRAGNEAAEIVPAELILEMLQGNYAPRVHEAVARGILLGPGSSQTINIPLAPSTTITSGSTIAEGEDTEALTAWNPTEASITLATHGIRRAVTEQLEFHSVLDVGSAVILSNFNALMDSKDKLVLGQSVNATNQVDKSALPFDLDVFNTVVATFKAQNPTMGGLPPAMALHPDQMRDFLEALGTANASVSANPNMPQDLVALFSGFQGGPKEYRGVLIFESANVAAADASNWSGFITTIGSDAGLMVATADLDGSGLGLVMKVTTPGSLPDNKLQRYISAYAEYGATITNQSNFLEVISQS